MSFSSTRRSQYSRLINFCLIVTFVTTLVITPRASYAQEGVMGLPQPGTMVNLSPAYVPLMITGLTIHPENPLLMDFIVSTGNSGMNATQIKKESDRLIKYFLACLTIPENNQWVNLSPYEKDRIIPKDLGQTVLGQDMLAQDYLLKQLTASLIYPEKNLGKSFWDKVYAKASQMYGTTQIPVNTFNKVWILPDTAKVFEHKDTVFVVKSHLKVMLDEDYLALSKHVSIIQKNTVILSATKDLNKINSIRDSSATPQNDVNALGSQIIRQIILPAIEQEVNKGQNFAQLRQIYNSMILAVWFKKNLKEALLNQVYSDKSKVNGVNVDDPSIKEKIYKQYLQAYKKGVFNYIKEDSAPVSLRGPATLYGGDEAISKRTTARKYFSGGITAITPAMLSTATASEATTAFKSEPADNQDFKVSELTQGSNPAMRAEKTEQPNGSSDKLSPQHNSSVKVEFNDAAMMVSNKADFEEILGPQQRGKRHQAVVNIGGQNREIDLQIPKGINLDGKVNEVTFAFDIDRTLTPNGTVNISEDNLVQIVRAFRLMKERPGLKVRFVFISGTPYKRYVETRFGPKISEWDWEKIKARVGDTGAVEQARAEIIKELEAQGKRADEIRAVPFLREAIEQRVVEPVQKRLEAEGLGEFAKYIEVKTVSGSEGASFNEAKQSFEYHRETNRVLDPQEQLNIAKALSISYLRHLETQNRQNYGQYIEQIDSAGEFLGENGVNAIFEKATAGIDVRFWPFDSETAIIFLDKQGYVDGNVVAKDAMKMLEDQGVVPSGVRYNPNGGGNFTKISLFKKAEEIKAAVGQEIVVGAGDSLTDDFLWGSNIENGIFVYLGKRQDVSEYENVIVALDDKGHDFVEANGTPVLMKNVLDAMEAGGSWGDVKFLNNSYSPNEVYASLPDKAMTVSDLQKFLIPSQLHQQLLNASPQRLSPIRVRHLMPKTLEPYGQKLNAGFFGINEKFPIQVTNFVRAKGQSSQAFFASTQGEYDVTLLEVHGSENADNEEELIQAVANAKGVNEKLIVLIHRPEELILRIALQRGITVEQARQRLQELFKGVDGVVLLLESAIADFSYNDDLAPGKVIAIPHGAFDAKPMFEDDSRFKNSNAVTFVGSNTTWGEMRDIRDVRAVTSAIKDRINAVGYVAGSFDRRVNIAEYRANTAEYLFLDNQTILAAKGKAFNNEESFRQWLYKTADGRVIIRADENNAPATFKGVAGEENLVQWEDRIIDFNMQMYHENPDLRFLRPKGRQDAPKVEASGTGHQGKPWEIMVWGESNSTKNDLGGNEGYKHVPVPFIPGIDGQEGRYLYESAADRIVHLVQHPDERRQMMIDNDAINKNLGMQEIAYAHNKVMDLLLSTNKAMTAAVERLEGLRNALVAIGITESPEDILKWVAKEAKGKDVNLDQLSYFVGNGGLTVVGPRNEFIPQFFMNIQKNYSRELRQDINQFVLSYGGHIDVVTSPNGQMLGQTFEVPAQNLEKHREILRILAQHANKGPVVEIAPGLTYQKPTIALTALTDHHLFVAQAEEEFLNMYRKAAEEAKVKFPELYQLLEAVRNGTPGRLALTKQMIEDWDMRGKLIEENLKELAPRAVAGFRAIQNPLNAADFSKPINMLVTLLLANELAEMTLERAKLQGDDHVEFVVGGEVRYQTPLMNRMIQRRLAALGITVHSPQEGVYLPIGATSFVTTLLRKHGAFYGTSSHAQRMVFGVKVMGLLSPQLSPFARAAFEKEGVNIEEFEKARSEGAQLLIEEMVGLVNRIEKRINHVVDTGEPLVLDLAPANDSKIRQDIDNPQNPDNIDVSGMYAQYLSESYTNKKVQQEISDAFGNGLEVGYQQANGSSFEFNRRVFGKVLGEATVQKIDWQNSHPDSFFDGTGMTKYNKMKPRNPDLDAFIAKNQDALVKFFGDKEVDYFVDATTDKNIAIHFQIYSKDAEYTLLRLRKVPFIELPNGNLLVYYTPSLYDGSQDVSLLEVVAESGLPAYLKDKPVGYVDMTTDPDGDRFVVMQVEKNDAETKDRLKRLNVAYLRISDDKIVAVYTPNQNFFQINDSLIQTLRERGEFRQDREDFDEYNENTFFAITTTVSTNAWRDIWTKNKVPYVMVPVGFKEISRVERLVEYQIMMNKAREAMGLKKRRVVVHDVFGKAIDLGYNPRLLFAGEESGGLVVGSSKLLKSLDGTREFLGWREKNAVEASALMMGLLAKMFNKARGDITQMSLSKYLETLYQENGVVNGAELRRDYTLVDNVRKSQMNSADAKKYNQEGIDKRDMNDTFFVGLAFALEDGKITLDDVKAILKDAVAHDPKVREEMARITNKNEDETVRDLSKWLDEELVGYYFQGDGVYMQFKSGGYAAVRPSGTEPNMKGYPSTHDAYVSALLANAFALLSPYDYPPALWREKLTEAGAKDLLDRQIVSNSGRKLKQYQRGLEVDNPVSWAGEKDIQDALVKKFPNVSGLGIADVLIMLGPRSQKEALIYDEVSGQLNVSWVFDDKMKSSSNREAEFAQALNDAAMKAPGGIDLNSRNLKMESSGQKVNITFDPAMIAQFRRGDFSGVRIQILDVVPVNLMPLLGLKED